MSEIITIDELASWLRCSRRTIYELTSERGRARAKNPIPVLRINNSLRFVRTDVERWLETQKEVA